MAGGRRRETVIVEEVRYRRRRQNPGGGTTEYRGFHYPAQCDMSSLYPPSPPEPAPRRPSSRPPSPPGPPPRPDRHYPPPTLSSYAYLSPPSRVGSSSHRDRSSSVGPGSSRDSHRSHRSPSVAPAPSVAPSRHSSIHSSARRSHYEPSVAPTPPPTKAPSVAPSRHTSLRSFDYASSERNHAKWEKQKTPIDGRHNSHDKWAHQDEARSALNKRWRDAHPDRSGASTELLRKRIDDEEGWSLERQRLGERYKAQDERERRMERIIRHGSRA
ncbi:hypothetical protein F5Y14DRAFT_452348 [Nemania sp. NC0429]|nr:hypothetical protein F5Y14DRAFT_452348 [Nemania sp. NC0429]